MKSDSPGWSRVGVPARAPGTVLAFLRQRFPRVEEAVWRQRLAAGQVCNAAGKPLAADMPVAVTTHLLYRRTVQQEVPVPFAHSVLHQDSALVVVDKPHFLPTAPAGQHAAQTLLTRLQRQLGLPQLSPLHRLDKDTAGVVLFCADPALRDAYHSLFRNRQVDKVYEAVARWHVRFATPVVHRSRLEPGGPRFFTMMEVPGEPNSQTSMEVIARHGAWALYRLRPESGRKHQLRVHMAALGVPIRHDAFYPAINDPSEGDFSRPLQLLARRIAFNDPLTGALRVFESRRQLQWPPPEAA